MHESGLPLKIKFQDQVIYNAYAQSFLTPHPPTPLDKSFSKSIAQVSGPPPVPLEAPAQSLVHVTSPALIAVKTTGYSSSSLLLLQISLINLAREIRICFQFKIFGFSEFFTLSPRIRFSFKTFCTL